jgi:oligopeptide/dipeptide ABC transporter ATP-binding protein
MSHPILHIDNLRCEHRLAGGGRVRAVDELSLRLFPGETVVLVGEAGSGRTTIARAIFQLEKASGGRLVCHGYDLLQLHGAARRSARRVVQWVPGHARESFDPSWTLRKSLCEPLLAGEAVETASRDARVTEAATQAGLSLEALDAVPGRVDDATLACAALARALVPGPELLVVDEPGIGLEAEAATAFWGAMAAGIRKRFVAALILTADLARAARIGDRIGVLLQGRLVEIGPAGGVWEWPLHPYTQSLVSELDRKQRLPGPQRPAMALLDVPRQSTGRLPACALFPRCPAAHPERCVNELPPLRKIAFAQRAACHFAEAPVDPDDLPEARAPGPDDAPALP